MIDSFYLLEWFQASFMCQFFIPFDCWEIFYCMDTLQGRGMSSRAREWTLAWHSEMTCPRRHPYWQSRRLYGKGLPGGEQQCEGMQEDFSAWFTVSNFIIIGLVSGLSLVNLSDSGSFLVSHTSLSSDIFQHEIFWEMSRTLRLLPPLFSPSQILLGEGNGHPLGVLAWRIPGMGSHRVGHDRSDLANSSGLVHSLTPYTKNKIQMD